MSKKIKRKVLNLDNFFKTKWDKSLLLQSSTSDILEIYDDNFCAIKRGF